MLKSKNMPKEFWRKQCNVPRGVNLTPSLWARPGPLFIKPMFRGPPNEGAKKKPQPP